MTGANPPPKVFEEIDDNLRKAYEELLNEALPQRFLDVIQGLKDKRLPELGPEEGR